jgi:predicted ATP-grasp superfamily ATP-dependent carboligase
MDDLARDSRTLPRVVLMYPNDGGLTVARRLIRRGVEVHALTDERYAYVLAGRGVRGRVMPDIRRRPEVWMDELTTLAAGDGAVVLSGSDAATEWLAHNRAEIPSSLRTFESKDGVHLALMNKMELYRLAEAAGVRTPGMWHVRNRDELAVVRAGIAFPCILKPTLGHVAKELVGVGTVRIESDAELLVHAGALLDHHLDLVLTELVPGPESALEGAVTIRDRDGRYTLEYGRHKVRQWPPDYGTGSLLESVDVPEMLALNRRLLDHVGYVGLSSCEAKRHAVNGELYLIEINVRMPANYGLSEASGVDGAWRLYATLAELPLGPQPRQVAGRKVMMHPDLLAAWAELRSRRGTPAEVLRSWRGTRDFGVFRLRDPKPALAMISQELRERTQLGRLRLPFRTRRPG